MAARQQAGFSNVVRGDEELGKYQNKYEESMNPFEAFRGRVRTQFSQFLQQRHSLELVRMTGTRKSASQPQST